MRGSMTSREVAEQPLVMLAQTLYGRLIDSVVTTAGSALGMLVESDDVAPRSYAADGRWRATGPNSWIDARALPDKIVAVPLPESTATSRFGIVIPNRDPLPTTTRTLLDVAQVVA